MQVEKGADVYATAMAGKTTEIKIPSRGRRIFGRVTKRGSTRQSLAPAVESELVAGRLVGTGSPSGWLTAAGRGYSRAGRRRHQIP